MGMEFVKLLPTPAEIREEFPLANDEIELKKERDRQIADVIKGIDDRFLLIIGPCSADSEDPVCDYISRLASVAEKVRDRIIIIPRIYTNKPRTTGEGYKGIVHQPDPEGRPDFYKGLVAMRKMHIRAIKETGLTAADEMLYPDNWGYVQDILSYVAIGARSVEDQQHRIVVSGFDCPAGMKNPTSGDLNVMLNSLVAAQNPHTFTYRGYEVHTTGNKLAHTILRGTTNKHGNNLPNYHYEDLELLCEKYAERDLVNPACIVDTNHSNSNK
nr:3-deoxy-7-phosphoheptulonate synthase [Lachnospiraceae bacterium]